MILTFYKFTTVLLKPYLEKHWMGKRLDAGKEDPERFLEKFGIYEGFPPGKTIWCHGASVGETMALLPLLKGLREKHPDTPIILTSCTVTSRDMITPRLPKGVTHIFAPLDVPLYVNRFLEFFTPPNGHLH